jgi:Rieske Fe-S protein
MSPQYERLNRWIDQLQANEHPELEPTDDPAEGEILAAATAWAALRPGADEPDPAFLARLRGQLFPDAAPESGTGTPGAETPVSPPIPVAHPRPAEVAPLAVAPPPAPTAAPVAEPRVVPPSTLMERRMSRRSLLSGLGAAAAGLIAGLGLQGFLGQQELIEAKTTVGKLEGELEELHEVYGDRNAPPGQLPEGQGKWFAVAHTNDVQIGEAIPVTMGAVKGFLVRESETKFNALSGICTHLGCDLSWVDTSKAFVCGCHGSSFDTTGAALTGPALYYIPLRHLPIFSWKVQDDVVYVLA